MESPFFTVPPPKIVHKGRIVIICLSFSGVQSVALFFTEVKEKRSTPQFY